ncbi:MAG: hypothetical protein PWP23_2196 [Candidatus Sumerlaeota bacterium]|nr:hypothetical protein [Candidatus Sumerlaeota bacterium]
MRENQERTGSTRMLRNLWRVSFLTMAAGLLATGMAWGQETLSTDSFEGAGSGDGTISVTPRMPRGADSDDAETYRLVLLDHAVDKNTADGLAADLSAYDDVEVVAHGDGTYSVHLGKFATEADAMKVQNSLLGSGFIVFETIKTGGAAATSAAPTGEDAAVDPEFQRMLDEIRRKQEGGDSVPIPTPAAVAATPAPTPMPTASPTDSVNNQIDQLRQAATEAENQNKLQEAVTHWESVKNIAQEGPVYEEATANIRRLNEVLRNEQALHDSEGGVLSPLVLGGIVVGVLLVAAVIGFVVVRGRKKNAELKKRVESIKKSSPVSAAPAATPPAAQAAGDTAGVKEVDSSARIRPGTMMASKEKKKPSTSQAPIIPAQQTPPPSAAKPATPPPAPPPAPPAGSAPASGDNDGIKLDFLFEEPAEGASSGADGEAVDLKFDAPPDARKPGKSKESSTQFIIPPMPDVAPGAPPPTAAPESDVAAPSSPGDANVFYEQDFEAEEIGAKPANWRGDYEYASLTVVQNPDAPEHKCLKFEKKSGVGSAYYSCKFPNASGRIAVEFDIRCDEKNKYLLGFYIERDEDFRQSIHTIVHRTNSSASPTLRIQNEATPYEFGKWTHIKFEIDLPRHIIDGHADGEAIANGVRLNSCPKSINTLSIRDNLATTGVLLIDNIKIYRFR